MILRLLLIFSLSSLGSSFKYSIEKDRCTTDTTCFVRKSCLESESDDNELVRYKDKPLKTGVCDVFLQVKSFSARKFHVVMQVNSSREPITTEGVALKQGKIQFKCSDGVESTENENLEIDSFGDRHSYNPNLLICSFTIKVKGPQSMIAISNFFMDNDEFPVIVFTSGQTKNSVKWNIQKENLWDDMKLIKCDPDIITSSNSHNDSHIFEMIDSTRSPISCLETRKLVIKHSSPQRVSYPEKLFCNKNNMWQYESGGQIEIVKKVGGVQQTIDVFCTIRRCSLCQPLQNVPCGAGCTAPNSTNIPGECATLTCPKNMWRLSDGKTKQGEMECKHKAASHTNQRDSVWHLSNQPITQAACAHDADCSSDKVSGLDSTCPKKKCPTFDWSETKDVFCSGEYVQLSRLTGNEKFNHSMLFCDILTGKYKDDDGVEIPKGSRIFCEAIEATTLAPVVAAASVSTGMLIGIGVGVLLLLLIGIGVSIPVVKLYRREKEHDGLAAAEKALAARIACANSVEPDGNKKDIPPECEMTIYEKRKLERKITKRIVEPNAEIVRNWTNATFCSDMVTMFFWYTTAGRMTVLHNLTAFDQYALGEKKDIKKKIEYKQFKGYEIAQKDTIDGSLEYGNLLQFFFLWKHCANERMACYVSWEYMWRFMKLLYENFAPHDDQREICQRLVRMVVGFARPMLIELTWNIKLGEEDGDTWMRFLVIRMLLWAEAPDVLAELERQADLPFHEMQPPLRMIVLQYAVRHLGRAEAIKEKYWAMVEEDTHYTLGGLYGSIRQQILYALCTARDDSKKNTDGEFKVMRETIATIFNYASTRPDQSYTPHDQYWAMRGAAEYVTNMKPAVDTFVAVVPENHHDCLEKLVLYRCKNGTAFNRPATKVMTAEWKPSLINLVKTVSEMCTTKTQFEAVATASSSMLDFVRADMRKSERETEIKNKKAIEEKEVLRKKIKADRRKEAKQKALEEGRQYVSEPSEEEDPKKPKKPEEPQKPKESIDQKLKREKKDRHAAIDAAMAKMADDDDMAGDSTKSRKKRKIKQEEKEAAERNLLGEPIEGLPFPQLYQRASNFYNVMSNRKVADLFHDALELKLGDDNKKMRDKFQ